MYHTVKVRVKVEVEVDVRIRVRVLIRSKSPQVIAYLPTSAKMNRVVHSVGFCG